MTVAAKELFMKPARSIAMCVLLAGQFALAQTFAATDDARPAQLAHPAATTRRAAHRRFAPQQQAQTGPEQVLYSFGYQGGPDGDNPIGNLVFDSAGNLYGVTLYGGSGSCQPACGTVYELSPNGSGGWTEAILYSFQGGNDGIGPNAGLLFDSAGNLYGTTAGGGTGSPSNCVAYEGCGTVFELSPNGSGSWTETVLYSFQGGSADGYGPGGLVFDNSGNLYGTTLFGGASSNCSGVGCGTVYELSPGPEGWFEKILYNFQGKADGFYPAPGLTFDTSANLYGSAGRGGGTDGACCGTVFQLSAGGSGWTEVTLYSFQGESGNPPDAEYPNGGLVFDPSGNLWGTTVAGLDWTCSSLGLYGCGTAFKLSPGGNGAWAESIPFAFPPPTDLYPPQGAAPATGLIADQLGNFYGATPAGGSQSDGCLPWGPGCGVVFQLSPSSAGGLTETVLYTFQGSGDGWTPGAGVILDQAGHLYGVTERGGSGRCVNGCGAVYEVSVEPLAALSPAGLSYANQTISFASPSQNVILTNNGNKPLTISSTQITGTNANEFSQQNNCPSTLQALTSCTVSVTFLPTSVGSATASLTVTDNASGSPQSVPLTGTGVIDVTFSSTTVTFPSQYVGTSGLPQAVTLTNNTNNAIAIKTVTASPSDFAALNSCPDTLPPGGYCSVGVFFDPTTSGTRNGVLTIADTAPTGQQTVMLTGTGEDFSMFAGSPSASVTPGEMAKYTVEVAPAGGFSQAVAMICTGAPVNASCSVSPSSVKLSGSQPVPVTISVSTAGSSAGITYPAGSGRTGMLAMWLAFAGLPGVVLVDGRRRAWMGLLCVVLAMVMWTACGGGGTGSGGTGGSGPSTPAGSYNLTVVGTFSQGSANLVHSTKLTLIVQ
jgi:uncharacterized repeat protein (TIGR03803 family)